ncbi:MAG: IS4 family transposase [Crocosphaera sp.]|nr:IS4 family transposase [Crocosphaera sp.]
MKTWVEEELKYLDLGDKRLNTRLGKMVSELSEHPHETVPQAIEKPSDVQATYEFWENRHVKAEKIIEAHKKATIEKIKEELFSKLEKLEPMAEIAIKLRRTPRRKPRIARLQVKWTSVEIQAPLNKPDYREMEPIKVNAIVAEEIQAPKGEKAVKWVLLTTLAVNNLADAQKVLKYYTYRWLIERFHYVLKTGCGIEKLMLDKGERLERALATYSIIASRILWLKYCAVETPDEPADIALEEEEWQVLYCVITKKKELPSEIPTIYECVRWIGRLGGFMCRKGDGEPGVQTLWKGWQRLSDYLKMWMIIKEVQEFIQI